MKLILSKSQIMKLVATLSLEDIENRLDYNWQVWDVQEDADDFELTKQKDTPK